MGSPMRCHITNALVAVAAAGAVTTLGLTTTAGAATRIPQATGRPAHASLAAAVPGGRLWVARYNHGNAASLAVSPDGTKVFVTGTSRTGGTPEYSTVAYSTSTGAQLWARRYAGPGEEGAVARMVAVSPGGNKVFVTGDSPENDGANWVRDTYVGVPHLGRLFWESGCLSATR
jgi:DNA-binding beta-propeller fold protein YncE